MYAEEVTIKRHVKVNLCETSARGPHIDGMTPDLTDEDIRDLAAILASSIQ